MRGCLAGGELSTRRWKSEWWMCRKGKEDEWNDARRDVVGSGSGSGSGRASPGGDIEVMCCRPPVRVGTLTDNVRGRGESAGDANDGPGSLSCASACLSACLSLFLRVCLYEAPIKVLHLINDLPLPATLHVHVHAPSTRCSHELVTLLSLAPYHRHVHD